MGLLLIIIIKHRSVLNRRSNSQQSQRSHHHLQEAPEVYRLETRAYKDVATENDLYNTTSTIHNGYYSKQTTRKFKTA